MKKNKVFIENVFRHLSPITYHFKKKVFPMSSASLLDDFSKSSRRLFQVIEKTSSNHCEDFFLPL
jgi:hypothetical protein